MGQTIGRNVQVESDGKKLTITVDLAAATERSASGKTAVVASTQGNQAVGDGWIVGLNVYRKA